MKISVQSIKKSLKTPELLGIGCFEDVKDILRKASSLSSGDKEKIKKELRSVKFSGKCGETLFMGLGASTAKNIYLIGLGKEEKYNLERARRHTAKFLAQAKSFQNQIAALDLASFVAGSSLKELAAAMAEGARLSDYRFTKYKSSPAPIPSVRELWLLVKDDKQSKDIQSAVAEAEIICQGVQLTRDLANEPPNLMIPERLANEAKKMARDNGLSCKVLHKAEIKKLKMGGIIGVSQGSSHEPRFIILENRVSKPIFSNPIVLVGKGVTFDTGGISIKPSNDMDKMKFDMCGAAAVIGAMKVIAKLKLPIKVIGIAPVVENMPGSTAQRPGDIITCLNGKTVEVLNTDAEGRLILADALSYAGRFKPKALVDIATLTGACAVTFHDLASGVMGTDPDLVQRIRKAGERTGERVWELPLWDEYGDLIKAAYADIQNISKKYAGTITAGMFLKEFADHTYSWAHLDIAGTAWNDGGPKPLSPIGATGVGVRLFVDLVKSYL